MRVKLKVTAHDLLRVVPAAVNHLFSGIADSCRAARLTHCQPGISEVARIRAATFDPSQKLARLTALLGDAPGAAPNPPGNDHTSGARRLSQQRQSTGRRLPQRFRTGPT
jgi:hypothetical protein